MDINKEGIKKIVTLIKSNPSNAYSEGLIIGACKFYIGESYRKGYDAGWKDGRIHTSKGKEGVGTI